MIVVLGLYRGGSSTVAGVLYHLGACLGHELKVVPTTPHDGPGYCTFEDWPLRRAFLRCYQEPSLDPRVGFGRRVQIMRSYLERRLSGADYNAAGRSGPTVRVVPRTGCPCDPIAVKFPGLCTMGPEVVEAWAPDHELTFISVVRDPQVVARSVARWYPRVARRLTDRLVKAREQFLRGRDHLSVMYDELVEHPEVVIPRLARSIPELDPTPDQIDNAGCFVRRPTFAQPQEAQGCR